MYKIGQSVRKALFGAKASPPSLASATKGADSKKPLTTAVTRTYYIQAEEQEWVCLFSSHRMRRVVRAHLVSHALQLNFARNGVL